MSGRGARRGIEERNTIYLHKPKKKKNQKSSRLDIWQPNTRWHLYFTVQVSTHDHNWEDHFDRKVRS